MRRPARRTPRRRPLRVVVKPTIKDRAPLHARPGIPAAWVPLPTAEQRRNWKWIVIHHSATPAGGAADSTRSTGPRGWDELGYHFVIGNGTDTGDGQIEVGSRWPKQKQGATARRRTTSSTSRASASASSATSTKRPTAAQLAALEKLVAYMADTYHIKQSNIIGHKMTGKQTECPGNLMDIAQSSRRCRPDAPTDPGRRRRPPSPGTELMQTAVR